MKANVVKEASDVEVDNTKKGCLGQKTSKDWCTKQTDDCQKKGTCGEKNYCPVVD